ncbi:MAG: CpsD/CapB family tyrosine-protein kinase [Bacillota bacterium]
MFSTSGLKNENGYHIISANDPLSIVAEQYRKLRTNIEYSTFGKEMKVINFTSTFKGEGKTVTALNLATVYAQSGIKTLLIDMDLRRPKVHRAFNLINENGLTDLISKGKDIHEGIRQVEETLYLLPAGKKIPFSSEFLMSKQVKSAIKSLRSDFDRIIIDCPPIGAVTDATIISEYSDGTIVVLGSRRTKEDLAKETINTLRKNGANIIGSVLTRINKQDQKYGIGYYYEDDE